MRIRRGIAAELDSAGDRLRVDSWRRVVEPDCATGDDLDALGTLSGLS
jgi:hypothetical protein